MATLTLAKKTAAIQVYNAIKEICPQYNLLAVKAITAQAMCESAWNTSGLSKKYFNFFGMKCGSKWNGASVNMKTCEEYKVGVITQIKDNFRAYANLKEGIKGYCEFITGMSRYKNLLGCTDDETYIKNIKNDGWATSSTYISTLKSVMKTCEENGVFTTQLVNDNPSGASATSISKYKVGQTYTTTVNLNVRTDATVTSDKVKTLPKGTRLTAQKICTLNNDIWVRTSDGWVAAYYNGKNYIQ